VDRPARSSPTRRHPLRHAASLLLTALLTAVLVAAPGTAASAVGRTERLAVLADWTQTSRASYDGWNTARLHRTAWTAYAFDWSTDSCSGSPDNPLGFDFRLSCQRHDFGYRNYKAVGLFPSAKARLDNAFYADLKRRCTTYNFVIRPACLSLAWTYYQAVKIFGSVAAVSSADLDKAARIKADRERAAARH
jgi:hypothetical protein